MKKASNDAMCPSRPAFDVFCNAMSVHNSASPMKQHRAKSFMLQHNLKSVLTKKPTVIDIFLIYTCNILHSPLVAVLLPHTSVVPI